LFRSFGLFNTCRTAIIRRTEGAFSEEEQDVLLFRNPNLYSAVFWSKASKSTTTAGRVLLLIHWNMSLSFSRDNNNKSYNSHDSNDSHDDDDDDDVVIGPTTTKTAATAATPLLSCWVIIQPAAPPTAIAPASVLSRVDWSLLKKKPAANYGWWYEKQKQRWRPSSSSSSWYIVILAFTLMMMMIMMILLVDVRFHRVAHDDTGLALFTSSSSTTTIAQTLNHDDHPDDPAGADPFRAVDDAFSYLSASSLSSPCENDDDCFVHHKVIEPHPRVQVPRHQPGFPSYWNYASPPQQQPQPLQITYDARSIMINGDRVLLLGGSLHPVRATRRTWDLALDQAVHNGLNLITLYVFWSAHQPFPDSPLDWSFFSSKSRTRSASDQDDHDNDDKWYLADAIRSCAARGLFVHLRVGPYDCAEYTFGGIPEWLPLLPYYSAPMQMRRLEKNWMQAMEGFLQSIIDYMTLSRLWAYQGGPIILAQVENELGDDMGDFMQTTNSNPDTTTNNDNGDNDTSQTVRHNSRPPTAQDYADWCGEIVAKLSPHQDIVWTMCNGLSANNTISTFNGDWLANRWLESHGDTGRIQVDQPALWTEDEGGFQLWGEDSAKPSDYFWGTTARTMSKNALQWFARGGTHLNYYMWWGGYNRGRWAAAGILNAYATDAVLCPSGEPRQPKFGHFQALHWALAEIAPILLHAPSALLKNQTVQVMDSETGQWHVGKDQRMFVYRGHSRHDDDTNTHGTNSSSREVIFVENDSDTSLTVGVSANVSAANKLVAVEMKPHSSILMIDGVVRYDSGSIQPQAMSFTRVKIEKPDMLLNWTTWKEPVVSNTHASRWAHVGTRPMEQTTLNIMTDKIWSDYAWYTTEFTLQEDQDDLLMLCVDTDKANGIVAFLNGSYVDAADNHEHSEGNISHYLSLGEQPLKRGTYELALLSESFGYFNLVGRWIKSNGAKRKGITGDVVLFSPSKSDHNVSLVDGHRLWKSFAGLHVEREAAIQDISSSPTPPTIRREHLQKTLEEITETAGASDKTATWSVATFFTPEYDPSRQQLFLHATTGRGHLWLNGNDLGRYWNITRAGREEETIHQYSQEYYFLPHDYLYDDGAWNEILLFDVLGGNHHECELVLSWIKASTGEDETTFKDEVDFPGACLL
jgi:hypothetical protein